MLGSSKSKPDSTLDGPAVNKYLSCEQLSSSLEYQQQLLINFIDFTKTFDSVHRKTLWKIAQVLERESAKIGLRISGSKTKIMRIG